MNFYEKLGFLILFIVVMVTIVDKLDQIIALLKEKK